MAEWRFLRGWTTDELRSRLASAQRLPVSFDAHWDQMTLECGWSHVESRAVIARERPGAPEPGGAFVRATHLVEAFDPSDPCIVVAHYDAAQPLLHRRVLLELRAMGLHFLCPAMIEQVHDGVRDGQSRFELAFVTLEGHIERGRERFVLIKSHASGEVRFHIAARWRPGEFPNAWSRLGFALLGRRYQRAWHRLSHLRLRRLLREGAGDSVPAVGLRHEGPKISHEPIQLVAQRGSHSRRIDVEQETEHPLGARWGTVAALGALTGCRTFAPIAVWSTVAARHGERARPEALARRGLRVTLGALALGEIAADKTSWIPERTRALPILGRAIAGAVLGAVLATRGEWNKRVPSAIGAGAAVAGTFASHAARERLRRRWGWPSAALGLVEDLVVVGSATVASRKIA